MPTKLYVTNLSPLATLSNVRQLFSTCGEVVDVEFLAERSGRPTTAAYVTLATGVNAASAAEKLHGAMLHGRVVLVSVASSDSASDRKAKAKADAASSVQISRQYRDRHGMSYELDYAGLRLTLQFLFPEHEDATWRVRAAIAGEPSGNIEGAAHSRELAFSALSERCEHSAGSQLASVRWPEVAVALRSVRAM